MKIGDDAVGCQAVIVHGHALAVEVIVARLSSAGHFKERADVVGADAVAGLLDARPVCVVEIIFGG